MSATNEKATDVHNEFESEEQSNTIDKPDKGHDEGKEEVEYLDVSNSKAFKGNDSDGKVQWTPKSVIAVLSLAMLNSGEG